MSISPRFSHEPTGLIPRVIAFGAILLIAWILSVGPTGSQAAEMRPNVGLVSSTEIPRARNEPGFVLLDVPYIRQPSYLCVPTSAAMILAYQVNPHDPRELKALAESHKPKAKRNTTFTYWADMKRGLAKVGERWTIRVYPNTKPGFSGGLADMRTALRRGRPVMIDVHLGPGHTFVVMGFNDDRRVVYIRDPNVSKTQARILTYDELALHWNNHKFGNSRSLFISK